MRLSLRDERGSGEGAAAVLDVELGSLAPELSIGELLELLAARFPERLSTVTRADLSIDDEPVDPEELLSVLPLWAGSVLTLHRPGRATALKHRGPRTELTRLAGPAAGASIRLDGGAFQVGRSSRPGLQLGPPTRPVFRIDVDPDTGVAVLSDAGGEPDSTVRVDGRPLAGSEPWAGEPDEPDAPGAGRVVAAEDAVFRIVTRPTLRGPDGEPDRSGRMPHVRTPRVAVPSPSAQVPVPDLPTPASAPQPLSWLMMLAPLPIGIVMALVFSPLFLLMTTMTPVMALARWAEGKWRARKDGIRIAAETAEAKVRFAADLERRRRLVEAAARAGYADLGELADRARSGRRLWEVRPGDSDELHVVVGFGALPWRPELGRAGEAPAVAATFRDVLGEQDRLLDVPVEVDLRERTGLGVVGSDAARRLAQTVVVDLMVRHGPADVALALLVAPEQLPAWEWTKWLPHLTGSDTGPRIAAGVDSAVALLSRLADEAQSKASGTRLLRSGDDAAPSGARRTLIVIDGDDLLTGRVAALLGRLARTGARTVVVATRTDRLPSVCGSLVEPAPDGTVTVTDAITGRRTPGVLAIQASAAVCTDAARGLARWTDPEQATPDAAVPDRTRLVDLLLAAASGPEGLGRPVNALDPATVAALWQRGGSGLRAVLGAGENADVSIDLLSDGPHGLVVGTTGAGKSELLRSLVASLACTHSPDDLTFLLVDFKGGGAFDACVGLPHTVGLVTDLDEHLAARALRCLRAELRHRERRLREAGVSDLRDLLAPSPALPRLAIVIDEFATLAAELPGFLSALVDVAQRGRSLGIHLILATQRPQGVVDAKIRSNTNLRIALRVQDEADSRDVLGTRQAADIDRKRPGRAFVRLGAGEVVALQSAYVSASAPRERTDRIEIAPFGLLPEPPSAVPATEEAGDAAPAVTTDLEDLVTVTRAVAERGGYATPRTPWPAPLPERLDAWTLPEDGGSGPVPLALVDLPDEQRTDHWRWQPQDGSTLVLGADATDVAAALAAACLALARSRAPEVQEIIVVDGLGAELQALEHLPHVRAAVTVDDAERLSRVLDLVDAEITARRASPGPRPDLLVVLAGWAQVVESAERAGALDAAQRLERVLRDGASAGVRLLVSGSHERAIPSRVMAQLGTKLCLRLSDASSYTGLGLRARDVPDLNGLRALDLGSQRELQIGCYGDGSATGHAEAARRIATRYPAAGTGGAGLGVLGIDIDAEEVLGTSAVAGSTWRLGVARRYRDLGAVALSLAPGMHVVVAGPPGSGRTSALRMLATAARAADTGAVIQVVSPDPADWSGVSAVDDVGSLAEITGSPDGRRRLLLVDDVESLGPGAASALDKLLSGAPAQTHVVIAGRPDAFRGMQVWQRALALSRTGLLLRPAGDDGDVLRTRLPREAPLRPVPGRGYLVEAGVPEQVQLARVRTPEAVATGRPDEPLQVVAAGGVR